MQTGEVELLVSLNLLGQKGCLCAVWDRTNLIVFGMPAENRALAIDECLYSLECYLAELRALNIDGLDKHILGRQSDIFCVVNLAVVVAQNQTDILLVRCK